MRVESFGAYDASMVDWGSGTGAGDILEKVIVSWEPLDAPGGSADSAEVDSADLGAPFEATIPTPGVYQVKASPVFLNSDPAGVFPSLNPDEFASVTIGT